MAVWSEERKQASKEAYAIKMRNAEAGKVLPTMHKVETFNGEVVPEVTEDKGIGSGWPEEEKIRSMINTCTILPPNMIYKGRHIIENIQALNCFRVTQAMIDKVYENRMHDDFGQLVKIDANME